MINLQIFLAGGKMKNLPSLAKAKLKHMVTLLSTKRRSFHRYCQNFIESVFHVLLFQVHPFWIRLSYFIVISVLGFLALKVTKPRTPTSLSPYSDLDFFFTSVSAVTVSSVSTVEMEAFSNTQLIIIAILMLVGGEVFYSMLGIRLQVSKFYRNRDTSDTPENSTTAVSNPAASISVDHMELGLVSGSSGLMKNDKPNTNININNYSVSMSSSSGASESALKYNSMKCLGQVVLIYVLAAHILGSSFIALYIILSPDARQVLVKKGIKLELFALFTSIATFANGGFLPTNENMMVFKKNSGLLLLLIPQVLLGNTLYAPCLRFLIWVLERTTKAGEFRYILGNAGDMGYGHLVSGIRSLLLVATAWGFILVQFVLFCSLEWGSESMDGLSSYEKLVAALFQVVNSRHAGESVFDLSIISPAILALFVVMMYLPPYTTFFPTEKQQEEDYLTFSQSKRQNQSSFLQRLLFSPLVCLVVFVIVISIIEREKMKDDPLNFNLLNITVEVVSAYGNVGFSTGYSCGRRLEPKTSCNNASYGFVGKWSATGKFILILVMFFGRLKTYSRGGGQAWKLSST